MIFTTTRRKFFKKICVGLGPYRYRAGVAHVVERVSEKDEVAGARPAPGTKVLNIYKIGLL